MKRKKNITVTKRRLIYTILFVVGVLLSSCQAVRTITTTAEHKQIGDTSVVIQTKVTESYVGRKMQTL